jgi:ABC-2 type transport system permease protein
LRGTSSGGTAPIRLVAQREIGQRLRTRAFVISTAGLCALIIGAGVLSAAIGDEDRQNYDIALIGDSPTGLEDTLQTVADQFDIDVKVRGATSRDQAEAGLRDDSLDGAIDIVGMQVIWKTDPPELLDTVIDAAWRTVSAQQAARDAGLDEVDVREILSPAPLELVVLEPDDDGDGLGQLVGMATGVLLFISINLFSSYVLMGVVEEKSTGVIEVLLSHVRAHQLLTGKVLGLCVLALIQLAAMIVAGLVALAISGITVPTSVWVALPSTLFWFFGGFILYNTLFALAGSFVSRVEDAQSAAAPISMVFFAAYAAVFVLSGNTETVAARVMSVLPPFTPLLMPLRIATGAASVVEIVVAAALLIAAAYGMLRLAGSVYARTLLHRGARLRWKEALRARNVR